MKRIRKFNSVQEMQAFAQADYFSFLGMVKQSGKDSIMLIHTHIPVTPSNLVISCTSNIVTITADNATSIQYKLSQSSEYVTYTAPFAITQTVTVYAKATNSDGSITTSQQCEYVGPIDYSIPFYIKDISGSENTVQIKKDNSSAPTLTIEKSLDGETWESMGTTSTTAITATIPANSKLYLRCSTNTWSSYVQFWPYYQSINVTGNFNVGGNIMSLLYGSNFTGEETTFPSESTYTFDYLFRDNTKLVNASELTLPATTLTKDCYNGMFNGCTALTTAPVLPATTLAQNCYCYMFQNCTSLTTAPELPATTLTNSCYVSMFNGCTSLTTAPALPATTLDGYCYNGMFNGCTSLTTAPALPATTLTDTCYSGMFRGCTSLTTAPALPATTLAKNCYSYMFYGCTALTTAPALPATTLAQSCYSYMFQGCTNLNYIKCLATNISASSCTSGWVTGVSSTGTFVKDPSMSKWTTGTSGIPSGWTEQDAQD